MADVYELSAPIDGQDGPIVSVELKRLPTVGDLLSVGVTLEPPQLDGDAMLPILAAALCLPVKVVEALRPFDAYQLFGRVIDRAFGYTVADDNAQPVGRYARLDRGAVVRFPLAVPLKVLAEEQRALAYAEPTLRGMAKVKLSHLVAGNPLEGVTYAMIVPLLQQTCGLTYAEACALSWYDAVRLVGVLLPLAFAPAQATGGQ